MAELALETDRLVTMARDATGLTIPSVCGRDHWSKPLSSPDPKVRAEGLEALKQTLRDGKRYGASSVLLVPGVVTKDIAYDDAYKRSQAEIRKAIPLAEELGVKIACENVWNYFLLSPLEAARYVDEFKSPAVGWHFDVGNVITYGAGLGYDVFKSCKLRVTPVAEFVGWTVLNGTEAFDGTIPGSTTQVGPPINNMANNATVLNVNGLTLPGDHGATNASGDTIINAKIGVRTYFGEAQDVYVGYGHSLTGDRWYKDILRVEYRLHF